MKSSPSSSSRAARTTTSAVLLLLSMGFGFAFLACGGGQSATTEPATPTTTAEPRPTPQPEKPAPIPAPVEQPSPAETTATPAPEPVAEKCGGEWICVKVDFDSKKVEKRDTKLIGDPKIETTWSKWSDGRAVTFDDFSKGAVEVMLRRKANDKNEIVVKPSWIAKGGEIIIDRKDGTTEDFTHVGFIAAEQGGALLVDIRYMK